MLGLERKVIIGIDLAGKPENPTGWAIWGNGKVETSLLYTDNQILKGVTQKKPALIAVDAPFSLPKTGILREADKEMIKRGYRVFPPTLPAMKKLTLRAMKLNKIMEEEGFKTIEVHPISACKALGMPVKNWKEVQTALTQIGLKGDLTKRTLTSHEIDAVMAALTAYLYTKSKTKAVGNKREGYIIVPKRQDWGKLQI